MLVFIIALQSPEVSKDWGLVSRLCERTLRSVCAQTSSDFRVFLVCNERPAMNFTHPHLSVIERDFPIPASSARMKDKWRKLKVGLVAASRFAPAHFMLMDADDCVHNGLAEHARCYPESVGWSMTTGYLRDEGSQWLYRTENFFRLCGSSAIVRLSAHDLPMAESDPTEKFFILANGHSTIKNYMEKRGTPLDPLPFIGAVYVTSTGENDSAISMGGWQGARHAIRKLVGARPLTKQIRSEFGLYDL